MGSGTEPYNPNDIIKDGDYLLVPPDYRLTNTVPFTYRDGYTYLQILEELRKWVNNGLRDNLSNNLENLAADYNMRVTRLLGDVRKELEQYHALPEQLREQIAEAVRKYDDEFQMFKDTLTQWTKRQFESDKFVVFNWIQGIPTDINTFLSDIYNRLTVHGLLADDLSRMGCTAGDIDAWPLDISEMETEGKNFLQRLWGQRVFSPTTGKYVSAQDALLDMMEFISTGTGVISHTAQQIESLSMQDLQNRRVN